MGQTDNKAKRRPTTTTTSSSSSNNNNNKSSQREEAKDITRCVCGQQLVAEEEGVMMIFCEGCAVWQHVACMGLDPNHLPDEYYCERCHPAFHAQLASRRLNMPVKKAKGRANNNSMVSGDAVDILHMTNGRSAKRVRAAYAHDEDSSDISDDDGEERDSDDQEEGKSRNDASGEDVFLADSLLLSSSNVLFSPLRIMRCDEPLSSTAEHGLSRSLSMQVRSAKYHKDMTIPQMMKRASAMLEFVKRSKQELDRISPRLSENKAECTKLAAQFEADVSNFQRQYPPPLSM